MSLDCIPDGTVIEAFNCTSQRLWKVGSKWTGISLDGKYVLEGTKTDYHFSVDRVLDGKSAVPKGGPLESYRHLIVRHDGTSVSVDYAGYSASKVTVTHTQLDYHLFKHPSGKYWAVAVIQKPFSNVIAEKLVVMFKNDLTQGQWVLHESTEVELCDQEGMQKRENLIQIKQRRGYVYDQNYTYNQLIKI